MPDLLLYRISKTKYIRDLSGEGARRAGGRWNSKGIPVIYTADSTALAVLETLVHSPLNIVPKNRSILTLEVPSNIKITKISLSQLPENWFQYPGPSTLTDIGDRWWISQETLLLSVPSAVTPKGEGRNLLINPAHRDFQQIEILSVQDFCYSDRLFGQQEQ